jgi:hypothetical protein
MIPAVLVLLTMLAFTDTAVGRGVRRAAGGLWHALRRRHDPPDRDDTGTGQLRRRSALPFRSDTGPDAGFGTFNPQVSGQGTPAGDQQGGGQGTPAGGPVGAPGRAPEEPWPTTGVPATGPVPAWGTPPPIPPPPTQDMPTQDMPMGWPAVGWPQPAPAGPVPTWDTPTAVPAAPLPAAAVPVGAPAAPVSQPASGVYLSDQGTSVDVDPQPVYAQYPFGQVTGQATGPMAGGDRVVAARRAAVARALPRLRVTPHGELGKAMAALAADWGVTERTIHNDIQALTSALTSTPGQDGPRGQVASR